MKRKKDEPLRVRRVGREVLERINTLPEPQARRVVRFLALLYLRPADCREIARILVPPAGETQRGRDQPRRSGQPMVAQSEH